MQKYLVTALFLCLMAVAACTQTELEVPSFDVSPQKTAYKAGDTVKYNFTGNPDFITFYSGEIGKRYDFVNRLSATGIPKLQFTSARANGSQPNSLMVLVSTDFAGAGKTEAESVANIKKATWTDVTAKAVLSTGAAVSSGAIDLSDIAAAGKPAYVAFKYVATAGSVQNKWTISNLSLSNVLPDGTTYTIVNHTSTTITNYGVAYGVSPGWGTYRASAGYNWVISASSLVITGAATAAAATEAVETWSITGQVDLKRVSPDLGTFVKGMTTKLTDFTYKYTTPGTYTATFVGANNLIGEEKQVVKKLNITITQ